MMSRKTYREFADMFAVQLADDLNMPDSAMLATAKSIRAAADIFKRDNSAFDRVSFYSACGLNETGGLK